MEDKFQNRKLLAQYNPSVEFVDYSRAPKMKQKEKVVVDIFTGGGGLSLGAHEAGFSVPLAIDNDAELTSSNKLNFPNSEIVNLDLGSGKATDITIRIRQKVGRIAGLIGGPPCQGFSFIGKRDPDDHRNKLVFRYFELVDQLLPSFFLFENVPGILTEPFRAELDRGINQVSHSYQIIGPLILNAQDFGVPTNRPRVFVLGYLSSEVNPITEAEILAAKITEKVTVSDALMDIPSTAAASLISHGSYWAKYTEDPGTAYAIAARRIPEKGYSSAEIKTLMQKGFVSGLQPTKHTESVLKRYSMLSPGDNDGISRSRRLKWDGVSPTIRAGTGKDKGSYQSLRPIHPDEDRVISVREGARLQGFPDWFQFHPTIWHSFRMIGNSVSPIVSKAILKIVFPKLN